MGRQQLLNPKLALITSALLEEKDYIPTIAKATNDLFHLLMEITQLNPEEEILRTPVLLPDGKGIGPYWAAMCINDMMRTKKFVRGLFCAIQAAQQRFPGIPVHVLYAGTGPFATLALPMTTVFTADQVQFTFLEVNPFAHQMVQQTISDFGIQAFIREVVLTDATRYIPTGDVHILLSETMQRALDKEPQVAITHHLIPYLHPEGFLVPESIEIQAGLLNPANEITRMQDFINPPEHYIEYLQTIFELNQYTSRSFSGEFPTTDLVVSAAQAEKHPQLHLFTHIRVFGKEVLTPWQSGLTLPKKITDLHFQNQTHLGFSFQYLSGDTPGFHFRVLE